MKFAEAIDNREARTENGMKARASSANSCVDLFYNIGASRGKDIVPAFISALVENPEYAIRILQWSRDVRGGSGERQIFRDILSWLAVNNPEIAEKLLPKIPVLGRWDDLWSIYGLNRSLDYIILSTVEKELEMGNGLLAKWLPRQSLVINGVDFTKALREKMRLTPKEYRKLVVANTNVVEQYMCSRNWDEINFSHVPSLAHSRYKKAFYRNAESYKAYVEALVKGDKSVKVNATAVYPYDVLKGLTGYSTTLRYNKTELDLIVKQWEALPNFLGDNSILAMVDVSGSMTCPAGNSRTLTCMDVAISLGLYVADKLKGDFKDTFLTFSENPKLLRLKGDIVQKVSQMKTSGWAMNTDLHRAVDLILQTAKNGNVAQEDMPKNLVIFSDMQFDRCAIFDDSAMEMLKRKYEVAGYVMPNVIFWNLNSSDNTPVKYNSSGVALVSGFSPSILSNILSAESITPESVMLDVIMNPRYDF